MWAKEKAHKVLEGRHDPNYSTLAQFRDCPFHQGLHQFIKSNPGKPLLHIDIHGKADRKTEADIELGFMPL